MTRGLTLIELVVAMAVFALIAVLGLQSLTGSLRLRDRLTVTAEQAGILSGATALLRNDLSAALPMMFFPPEEARPSSAIRAMPDGRGFAISLGGQPALGRAGGGADATPRQRAEWRLDPNTNRLMRRAWPTLYPVSNNQAGPEIAVLDDVQGLKLRSYWKGSGWIDGLAPASARRKEQAGMDGDRLSAAPEVYSDALPRAVEITLITRDHGRITLVEYFQ